MKTEIKKKTVHKPWCCEGTFQNKHTNKRTNNTLSNKTLHVIIQTYKHTHTHLCKASYFHAKQRGVQMERSRLKVSGKFSVLIKSTSSGKEVFMIKSCL